MYLKQAHFGEFREPGSQAVSGESQQRGEQEHRPQAGWGKRCARIPKEGQEGLCGWNKGGRGKAVGGLQRL